MQADRARRPEAVRELCRQLRAVPPQFRRDMLQARIEIALLAWAAEFGCTEAAETAYAAADTLAEFAVVRA